MTDQQAYGDQPSPGGAQERARALVGSPALQLLRDVMRANQGLQRAIARRAGLSSSELTALEHLSDRPHSPSELARVLDVTTAAATGVVDRMQAHGHAERHPHPDDGRRLEVHLTASGREEILGHLMPLFGRLARHDATFTPEERAVVARYLEGARDLLLDEAEVTDR